LFGFLQGLLRFNALSVSYATGGLARLRDWSSRRCCSVRCHGALFVNTLAVSCLRHRAIALRSLWQSDGAEADAPLDPASAAVLSSLACVASLTNVDILLAAYFIHRQRRGIYAAAALVGKVVLFLPAAIVTVLLPKRRHEPPQGSRRAVSCSRASPYTRDLPHSDGSARTRPESLWSGPSAKSSVHRRPCWLFGLP
jgi:hypothetical protein